MNKLVSSLRFPQFAEESEWEEKKLGEVGQINPTNKKLPDNFIYIDLESVEKGNLLKETYINKEKAPSRAQRLLEKNDILFQMVRPYQMNNFFLIKRVIMSLLQDTLKLEQNKMQNTYIIICIFKNL